MGVVRTRTAMTEMSLLDLRDPVSSVSHLATALWAVFATLLMDRLSPRDGRRRAAVLIYGSTMVLLFLASGVFHGLHFDSPEQKRVFQRLDQSAIFLLIAGTNTPLLVVLLAGAWRRWFLRVVWGLALIGVACVWLWPKPPHSLIVGLYLGLGWFGLFPVWQYYRTLGWRALNWMWLGAACYTTGAVCELTQWPVIIPGWIQAHEVLHLFDSAGSIAFFLLIVRYVVPHQTDAIHPNPVA
jgi:hemolysin III